MDEGNLTEVRSFDLQPLPLNGSHHGKTAADYKTSKASMLVCASTRENRANQRDEHVLVVYQQNQHGARPPQPLQTRARIADELTAECRRRVREEARPESENGGDGVLTP